MMLTDNDPFLMLDRPCKDAVDWAIKQVSHAGLSVMCTFDLQTARHPQAGYLCPQHGMEPCDCQMVVLLIYRSEPKPLTMIVHGSGQKSWFSIVNTPQQRAEPNLKAFICHLLESAYSPAITFNNNAHAV
jgi:hypothetical protein